MSMLQNISQYVDSEADLENFNKNNAKRQEFNYLLKPVDVYLVNPTTVFLTDQVAMPALKQLYPLLAKLTAAAFRRAGHPYAERIERGLYDPLSTKDLLQLCERIQNLSKWVSDRAASELPIITYGDKCLIVIATRIHVVVLDVQSVLRMPNRLRELNIALCKAAQEEIITPFCTPKPQAEPSTTWLDMLTNAATQTAFFVADTAAGGALERAKNLANQKINQEETEKRQQCVAKATHTLTRSVISAGTATMLRAGVSYTAYKLIEYSIEQCFPSDETQEAKERVHAIAQTTSACITTIGALLWMRCLTPTIQRLHGAYDTLSQPQRSTVDGIEERAHKLVQEIRESLPHNVGQNVYWQNFENRAGQILKESCTEEDSNL